jgi:hypothetical protein
MIKITNPKKFSIFIAIIVFLIAGSIWGILKFKNRNVAIDQEQVYEVLVNIADQKAGDPVEDARSSLKKGDVIAYFPEGHSWSDTEKNSYLIIKIKLKPDDAEKLLAAETKEIKNSEKSPEGKEMGPQQETVRARKYFLDLPDFDTQKFWGDQIQPFADRVFDGGIIDKK